MPAVRDAESTFRDLYAASYRKLLAYARRRTSNVGDAEDIVAATFMVAWRRLDEVEHVDNQMAWLYGVARRTLANQRRGHARASALVTRMEAVASRTEPDIAHISAEARQDLDVVIGAMKTLSEHDQEILGLAAFENLSPTEIGIVLGVSSARARTGLYRARQRLRRAAGTTQGQDGGSVG